MEWVLIHRSEGELASCLTRVALRSATDHFRTEVPCGTCLRSAEKRGFVSEVPNGHHPNRAFPFDGVSDEQIAAESV